MVPNLYSLVSFLSRKRFAGKQNGQIRAPRLQKRHIRLKCAAQKTSYVLKNFLLSIIIIIVIIIIIIIVIIIIIIIIIIVIISAFLCRCCGCSSLQV